MSYNWHRLEKGIRDQDDGSDDSRIKTILDSQGRLLRRWNMMIALSCVIAVSMDPLFFYLPIRINKVEKNKCWRLDNGLKIIAYSLRYVTDFVNLLNISLQFICHYIDDKDSRKLGLTKRYKYFFSWYFVIDVLAILPLPQVLIPKILSVKTSSKFFNTRDFLTAVVVLQYVPRVLRIHRSRKILTGSGLQRVRIVPAEAAFNFFLYILASHVLGAFWYFLSIERETACWQRCFEKPNGFGCSQGAFRCTDQNTCPPPANPPDQNTSLPPANPPDQNTCLPPANPPNDHDAYFGIFLQAVESDVASRSFPEKLAYCLWWGLQNLSSLGQNLKTSTSFWENCFAASISITGMLLVLYFIGNLQIYMQIEMSMWLDNKKKEETKKAKEREIELWMKSKELPPNIMRRVMPHVGRMIEEGKDVDARNPLPRLPTEITKEIKRYMGGPLLRSIFIKMDGQLLDSMCDRFMPVFYTEKSYIVWEGDRVDEMFFIIRGTLLFTTNNGGRTGFFKSEYRKAGDFCGEEIITNWAMDPHSSSNHPISTRTVQALTEVEAFALKAEDLKFLASQFELGGKQLRDTCRRHSPDQWRNWAASIIQAAWRRYKSLRADKENKLQDALASSLSFGAAIYASRFAANALCTRKARVLERIPPAHVASKTSRARFYIEEQ